ncbi:hypothetical protein ACFC1R_21040 [Kitasatospora sp. NPDC056138]|uniref:hypothetical protein n=1 Tax=Kitasatospora sp. NPDC056138 TaxID=3345724 RepID=UPI0035DF2F6C
MSARIFVSLRLAPAAGEVVGHRGHSVVLLVGDARDEVLDRRSQPCVHVCSAGAAGGCGIGLQFDGSGEGVAVDGQELPVAPEKNRRTLTLRPRAGVDGT